jgi:hypothetical protein
VSKQTEDVLSRSGMERPTPQGGNQGEKTAELRELDEKALNDPKLVTSIEERLSGLRDLTRGERGKPAAEDEPDEEVETPEKEDNDEPAESDEKKTGKDDASKPTSTTLGSKDGKNEDAVQLPEAYVRAAIAYGWKKDDVIASFKTDPERMLVVLSNIYATRNKASAEFAALGRRAATEHAAVSVPKKPTFAPVDTKKLREQYGDDAGPLIEMIEAQNKAMSQLVEAIPVAKPEMPDNKPFSSPVEEAGVEQQVHSFFESDSMKPYVKIYGTLGVGETYADLSASQQEFRWKVLERADQIAGGAHLQGVQITVPEALEMAHLLVTQKYRDQILVDGIKEKVVKRAKSLTINPSIGKKKPGDSTDSKPGSRSKEQLVEDTQNKLNKLFGER